MYGTLPPPGYAAAGLAGPPPRLFPPIRPPPGPPGPPPPFLLPRGPPPPFPGPLPGPYPPPLIPPPAVRYATLPPAPRPAPLGARERPKPSVFQAQAKEMIPGQSTFKQAEDPYATVPGTGRKAVGTFVPDGPEMEMTSRGPEVVLGDVLHPYVSEVLAEPPAPPLPEPAYSPLPAADGVITAGSLGGVAVAKAVSDFDPTSGQKASNLVVNDYRIVDLDEVRIEATLDGNDNMAPTATSEKVPKARRVTLQRRSNFHGYGFHVSKIEGRKGHCIVKVDSSSPAAAGGVREKDRILEVNGFSVTSESHQSLIQNIGKKPEAVTLLLISEAAEKYHALRGNIIDARSPYIEDVLPKERNSQLYKIASEAPAPLSLVRARKIVLKRWREYDGFGFNLNGDTSKPGEFYIGKIYASSPAAFTGLKEGDRIIEVNELNVEKMQHDDVVRRINQNPLTVSVVAMDPVDYRQYKAQGVPLDTEGDNVLLLVCPDQRPKKGYGDIGDISTLQPPVLRQPPRKQKVQDYMAYAICTSLFCCLLIGCCAVSNAIKARSARKYGDIVEAYDYTEKARKLSRCSVLFGLFLWLAGVAAILILLWQLNIIFQNV